MGLDEVRAMLINAIQTDRFLHADRTEMQGKNLLYAEVVDPEFVIRLIQRCKGWEYSTSRHHFLVNTWCHTFTPQPER